MKSSDRAEHVGSLLRPPELQRARADFAERRLNLDQLREIEDRVILEALYKQGAIGLDRATDGEFRRGSWLTDMADAVAGFVRDRVVLDWKGPGGGPEVSSANAVGTKLRKTRHLTAHEVPFLVASSNRPFKVTLPAPSNFVVCSYRPGITEKFYPTRADLLHDLVAILREEVRWLVSQGVTYIQFDAPYYTHYLDPQHRAQMQAEGRDPDRELAQGIAGDNAALANVPRDRVTVAMHVCRGNSRSRWFTEGGYDLIAERLFGSLNVDRFLLEFDDERSGGFEPLRWVPAGKTVVLGLVTTKDAKLESQDDLRRRIDEAARYVPLERLAISPQCGFASTAAGNLLSVDEQWRKLELVADTARNVWGSI
ncbi:MAG TPA: 5-methyltetrahydropteroyltriglutamate--homocysteine S-methyltransferase [Bryobacteraceae bacterium]|jgi:5-methyltetrahydropteroyltriglutamate--homocysteine methyltransferase|nr:5-methyltetrahydropteroyltriglutamate--homocysteine S-methyltransferase [Bryobacteraceae bacterium]